MHLHQIIPWKHFTKTSTICTGNCRLHKCLIHLKQCHCTLSALFWTTKFPSMSLSQNRWNVPPVVLMSSRGTRGAKIYLQYSFSKSLCQNDQPESPRKIRFHHNKALLFVYLCWHTSVRSRQACGHYAGGSTASPAQGLFALLGRGGLRQISVWNVLLGKSLAFIFPRTFADSLPVSLLTEKQLSAQPVHKAKQTCITHEHRELIVCIHVCTESMQQTTKHNHYSVHDCFQFVPVSSSIPV